ncbi:peptidyl-prolyl cis-trans isomerase [Metabacillus malikii]|uniref:DMSO/TMAO reductase YedYZ molybdopterin-dependent catalytic subunit n=1 Tax=Metabacillus malikii TaxID=1504265 RepID=A0ABT9ZG99_9BACI|nr:peptidyl-prolyl cis-trans isomerase [Metabacillus malikii]MDQ0231311.1 DMSO/TMAO reductase YedYZ molybdopterin-dependent catalytic subunit [Metabacillus malikii]
MESIINIKGNVVYPITLDPGVWIFDDRKVDLKTYFQKENVETDELAEYTKSVSKHWEREIMEGAVFPPTLKTEKIYEKQKVLTGTFGIPLKPFLTNAHINDDAKSVTFVTKDEHFTISIEDAYHVILGFSIDGKPLREDGPVHIYFGDGSNVNSPIKHLKEIIVS